jgi:integrase
VVVVQTEVAKKINERTERILKWSDSERIQLVDTIISQCDYPHEKYVIVMLYIYGMRPSELMEITRDNFRVVDDMLRIILPTKKRGFNRVIYLSIESTPYMGWLSNYIRDNKDLIPVSWHNTTNINGVFAKIARKLNVERISPYMFRKFRLSFLAIELDASAYELQNWKGSKDISSVTPYVMMKPLKKFAKSIR